MMRFSSTLVFLIAVFPLALFGQLVMLEGYVFESGNRGYLNEVKITVTPKSHSDNSISVQSDRDGFFALGLPIGQTFVITAEKQLFHPTTQDLSTSDVEEGGKVFARIRLDRKPGYLFDVTLAEERSDPEEEVAGISGALIEIYNNTTGEEELVLKEYPDPNFSYTFQKGNHYTLLIRKAGYFNKRLEAYVDVDDCILCFDGLASIENVKDNLTEGLAMGSLLANIELKSADIGTTFKVNNIFYDLDQAEIRKDAAKELDKLAAVLKDNPSIIVELGSHTDSRGEATYNGDLSLRRAEAAVTYLVGQGVQADRIEAKGYGETKLTNKCADGVDCSPDQHQQNRRTEIKVLGIGDEDFLAQKSLADIKHEENFEQMLQEIQEQEVVQFRPGDEMPGDLKKMLEEEKQSSIDTIPSKGDTRDKSRMHRDPAPSPSEVSSTSPPDTNGLDAIVTRQSNDQASQAVVTNPEKELVQDAPKPVRDPARRPRTRGTDQNAIMEKRWADAVGLTPRPRSKVPEVTLFLSIPEDFDGFMIEVRRQDSQSNDELMVEIFGEVYEEKLASGEFSYLISGFRDFDHCYLFFEEKVQERYPNAKIIEFLSGRRL